MIIYSKKLEDFLERPVLVVARKENPKENPPNEEPSENSVEKIRKNKVGFELEFLILLFI